MKWDSEYIPQCGDVGFVGYDPGVIVSDMIAFFTRGRNEAKTKAVHQFQLIFGGYVVESMAKEGVVIRTIEQRLNDCDAAKSHFIIFRPPELWPSQPIRVDTAGQEIKGSRYGFFENVFQLMDGILRKHGWLKERVPFFTLLGSLNPRTMICSRAGNYCLYKGGLLPKRSLAWAPDDTFDWVVTKNWKVVSVDEHGLAYWGLPAN